MAVTGGHERAAWRVWERDGVHVDVILDPFGSSWPELRSAALTAEASGLDGVWTWDHLAGEVHGESHVLEAWTVLAALAEATTTVRLGPLVLNVANRRPGVLAVMAATLQQVAAGRLVLGLGAGGDRETPYWREQAALGVDVGGDAARRRQLEEAVGVIRQVWSGETADMAGEFHSTGTAHGFLRPDPEPPIVIGGFGPRMAELSGRIADGFNTQAGHPRLAEMIDVARSARAASGRDPAAFEISVFTRLDPGRVEPAERERLGAAGVDRLALLASPPYDLDLLSSIGTG